MGICSPAFALRFIEAICAIVALACASYYDGTSWTNFMIFTGSTALIICLLWMVLMAMGVTAFRGGVELVIDVIWSIFWLSASAAIAAKQSQLGSPSKLKASQAFGWISWLLWMASAVLSFLAMRAKGSVTIKSPAPGAPVSSAPVSGSVAMV